MVLPGRYTQDTNTVKSAPPRCSDPHVPISLPHHPSNVLPPIMSGTCSAAVAAAAAAAAHRDPVLPVQTSKLKLPATSSADLAAAVARPAAAVAARSARPLLPTATARSTSAATENIKNDIAAAPPHTASVPLTEGTPTSNLRAASNTGALHNISGRAAPVKFAAMNADVTAGGHASLMHSPVTTTATANTGADAKVTKATKTALATAVPTSSLAVPMPAAISKNTCAFGTSGKVGTDLNGVRSAIVLSKRLPHGAMGAGRSMSSQLGLAPAIGPDIVPGMSGMPVPMLAATLAHPIDQAMIAPGGMPDTLAAGGLEFGMGLHAYDVRGSMRAWHPHSPKGSGVSSGSRQKHKIVDPTAKVLRASITFKIGNGWRGSKSRDFPGRNYTRSERDLLQYWGSQFRRGESYVQDPRDARTVCLPSDSRRRKLVPGRSFVNREDAFQWFRAKHELLMQNIPAGNIDLGMQPGKLRIAKLNPAKYVIGQDSNTFIEVLWRKHTFRVISKLEERQFRATLYLRNTVTHSVKQVTCYLMEDGKASYFNAKHIAPGKYLIAGKDGTYARKFAVIIARKATLGLNPLRRKREAQKLTDARADASVVPRALTAASVVSAVVDASSATDGASSAAADGAEDKMNLQQQKCQRRKKKQQQQQQRRRRQQRQQQQQQQPHHRNHVPPERHGSANRGRRARCARRHDGGAARARTP